MPLLDVSSVLLDPMFVDTFTLTRFAQTVGSNGRTVNAPTSLTIYGVATNDKGDMLTRLRDGAQVRGNFTIHTKTVLSAGSPTRDADIVTWAGVQYTVAALLDYSRYGGGFVCAACELLPVAGG